MRLIHYILASTMLASSVSLANGIDKRHAQLPPPKPSSTHIVKKEHTPSHKKYCYVAQDLTPFDSIVADGDTAIILQGGKNFSLKMSCDDVHPEQLLDYVVRGHTLHLSRRHKKSHEEVAQQPVFVNVNLRMLKGIVLKGRARLTGLNIHSKGLAIRSRSSGGLKLRGVINITKLVQEGNGAIDIEWINTHHLKVIATNTSRIHLAGTVNILDIRAIGNAFIDARYLRAKNVIAQAGEHAEILVTAINALSGFASDFSNIKFYKTPKHLTRHNYASGNVMQMRHWN